MADSSTPRDQLKYYQSLLEEHMLQDSSEVKEYFVSKHKDQIEDLMYHILKYGDSWGDSHPTQTTH